VTVWRRTRSRSHTGLALLPGQGPLGPLGWGLSGSLFFMGQYGEDSFVRFFPEQRRGTLGAMRDFESRVESL
jgi:hypothetical protein